MKTFKMILIGLITLPQTIVGLITMLFVKKSQVIYGYQFEIKPNKLSLPFILVSTEKLNGVSLGLVILLNKSYSREVKTLKTIRHEYGHLIQGLITGWLYFIIIGIKSLFNNRMSLNNPKYQGNNYYRHFPENLADFFGKVKR